MTASISLSDSIVLLKRMQDAENLKTALEHIGAYASHRLRAMRARIKALLRAVEGS
jgi:hypothetical protein